jgi:hypothetical protein
MNQRRKDDAIYESAIVVDGNAADVSLYHVHVGAQRLYRSDKASLHERTVPQPRARGFVGIETPDTVVVLEPEAARIVAKGSPEIDEASRTVVCHVASPNAR